MPRRKREVELAPHELDLNRVIAANFKAAREFRGWTQEEVARRLGDAFGYDVPQASISIIERSVAGNRPRNISADELAVFAKAFDLPILWFLRPTSPAQTLVVGTENYAMDELSELVFGNERQTAEMRSVIDPENAPTTAAALSRYDSDQVRDLIKARDQAFTAQLDSTRRELQVKVDELAQMLEPLTKILGTADDGLLQPRWEGRLADAAVGSRLAALAESQGKAWDVYPALFRAFAAQTDPVAVTATVAASADDLRALAQEFLSTLDASAKGAEEARRSPN